MRARAGRSAFTSDPRARDAKVGAPPEGRPVRVATPDSPTTTLFTVAHTSVIGSDLKYLIPIWFGRIGRTYLGRLVCFN